MQDIRRERTQFVIIDERERTIVVTNIVGVLVIIDERGQTIVIAIIVSVLIGSE